MTAYRRLTLAGLLLFLLGICGGAAAPGLVADAGAAASSQSLSYGECIYLADQYLDAVREAKKCNSHNHHSPQCVISVIDDLTCPCPTYVNSMNRHALKVIHDEYVAFISGGCGAYFVCGAQGCPSLSGAFCEGERGLGKCVDELTGW